MEKLLVGVRGFMDRFTPEAETAWAAIPTGAKEKLLSKVWCLHCRTTTVIVDFGGRVEREDLILHGRCANCGAEVARVVEGA